MLYSIQKACDDPFRRGPTYGSADGAQREETGERVVGGVEEVVPVYHPEEARAVRLVVQLVAQLLQVRVLHVAGLALLLAAHAAVAIAAAAIAAAAIAAAAIAAAALAATAANGG